ncbi:MAG TPA: ribonuclease H family protein, partial [Methylomirabilota bacterium]|nr:ribonuclease H family protein [Methylomirabilota bacterium]
SARLPNITSVTSAELVAILLALQFLPVLSSGQKITVCSDSKAALFSIQNHLSRHSSHPNIISLILQKVHNLFVRGVSVSLQWIPAHVGIAGNELADSLAKSALNHPSIDLHIPTSLGEIKSIISNHIQESWSQQLLDLDLPYNALNYFLDHPSPAISNKLPRQISTTIHRIRMNSAKTRSTLSKWKKQPTPLCAVCLKYESISHVILGCSRFSTLRQQYLTSATYPNPKFFHLVQLLISTTTHNLVCFLLESGLTQML